MTTCERGTKNVKLGPITKVSCTYLNTSKSPGSKTAPQLKYCTPSTSGVSSLNLRMASSVKLSNALPSPPPFGNRSNKETNEGIRSFPTVAMKWSANEEPRCGVATVVIERTLNLRCLRCVVRYRQSSPP